MSNLTNRILEQSFDPVTHSLSVTDQVHRMNHLGMMFHASGKVTGMVDTNVDEFMFITGAKAVHFQRLHFDFGRGDIDILSYEDTLVSGNGSDLTSLIFNQNRESTTTPLLAMYGAPTVTDVGTLLHTSWIPPTGTGTGQSADGISGGGNGEEWLLKPNSKYLIRITNNSGATIDYRWEIVFYEPDF